MMMWSFNHTILQILSRYEYQTVTVEGDQVTPVTQTYHFKTSKHVPRTGMMLVGWGGNNGSTVSQLFNSITQYSLFPFFWCVIYFFLQRHCFSNYQHYPQIATILDITLMTGDSGNPCKPKAAHLANKGRRAEIKLLRLHNTGVDRTDRHQRFGQCSLRSHEESFAHGRTQ